MVRTLGFLGALLAVVAAQAPAPSASAQAFTMTTVNTIQARVQSDAATWDEANQKFGLVLKQNTDTFPLRYQAAMDTVNTASVEGALFYVQTEGISKADNPGCSRKTNMSYVWFLNITIVQPTFALAEYQDNGGVVPEYGPFVAMDGGMCTPIAPGQAPLECLSYNGLEYNKELGLFVGGESRKSHPKGNYNDNYWFSFPNSCVTKRFEAKDDKCRATQKGGLCPLGVQPDGIKCTYSFDVLGYVYIDDLVGITGQKNSQTGNNYKSRFEFCQDGKTEYDFGSDKSDLESGFWAKPLDIEANANRTQAMLKFYNAQVDAKKGDSAHMKKLPTAEELSKKNPPCWKNSPRCAKATHGCRRKLMAQVCEVCSAPADDCKKPGPGDVPAPTLTKAIKPPVPTKADGKPVVPPSISNNDTAAIEERKKAVDPTSAAATVTVAIGAAVALAALVL